MKYQFIHSFANPDSVRKWLAFLIKNHKDFIKMHGDGKLDICEEALKAFEDQSELAEIHNDLKYTDSEDEEEKEEVVVQPPAAIVLIENTMPSS